MCIRYRGTDYDYALDVAVQLDSRLLRFHILMTKHMADHPYRYAGICLDDGFQVNTKKPDRHVALCEIIEKIIDSYICAEKAYAERYPGEPVKPFKNIIKERPDIYRKFNKRMEKALLLSEYDNIRRKLTLLKGSPHSDPEEKSKEHLKSIITLQYRKALALLNFLKILPHCVPILYDCKEMTLALNTIQKNPQLCKAEIKYRRV
jgi:hypothetical protein